MYRGKRVLCMFHLLVIKDCEPVVQSYMNDIKSSGLYASSDEILFNIRYTDMRTMNNVLAIINTYSKTKILNIVDNNTDVSGRISKYWNRSLNLAYRNNKSVKLWHRLGEIETIMDMILQPAIHDYIQNFDIGIFLNSKSMSHITELANNNRPELAKNMEDIQNIMSTNMLRYKRCLNTVINEDRWGPINGKFANSIFGFKPQWFIDLNIEKYFDALVDLYDDEYAESLLHTSKAYTYRYGKYINIVNGKYSMINKHALANFPWVMNGLLDAGYKLHSRGEISDA